VLQGLVVFLQDTPFFLGRRGFGYGLSKTSLYSAAAEIRLQPRVEALHLTGDLKTAERGGQVEQG